jgi:hypothetical protein
MHTMAQEQSTGSAQLSPEAANYDLHSPSVDSQGTNDSRIGHFSPPGVARGIYMAPYSPPDYPTTVNDAHDSAQDQLAGSHFPSQILLQENQSSDQGSVDQQAAAPASKAPRAP